MKLFSKVFNYKERLKHDLQTAINQKSFHESTVMQASYELEAIDARLESFREDLSLL
jgi:hypothetical protein